jgi:uncharacterized protein
MLNRRSIVYHGVPLRFARHLTLALIIVLFIERLSPGAVGGPDSVTPILGTWEGTIKHGRHEDPIRVVFDVNNDKRLAGSIYSPKWGSSVWPMPEVSFDGGNVRFSLMDHGYGVASFRGRLSGGSITGKYSWHQSEFEMVLTRGRVPAVHLDAIPGISPTPEVGTKQVLVRSGDITLSGGISFPVAGGKHPAVVLVSGSGADSWRPRVPGAPCDNAWLAVVSDALTRNGIVTLRLDDRGVGRSGGSYENSSFEDLKEDLVAAIKSLKGLSFVDESSIGILGISQGASISVMAAADSAEVAFVVLLSSTGVPHGDVYLEAARRLRKDLNLPPKEAEAFARLDRALVGFATTDVDESVAFNAIRKSTAEDGIYSDGNQLWEVVRRQLLPISRSDMRFDPRPVLRKLKQPVLVINGEEDLIVPYDQNLPVIRRCLLAAGNPKSKVIGLVGHDHALRRRAGARNNRDEVEPEVIRSVIDWILSVVRREQELLVPKRE